MQVIDQALIDEAIQFARQRYPEGEALVAALRTQSGRILTSVPAEARLSSAELCAETGAICEAHKLNEAVVASVCVYRPDTNAKPRILPACGVCQERLAFWGLEVQVAVPGEAQGSEWQAKSLRELRPFYWGSFHE
jgi:cytidine deaminase